MDEDSVVPQVGEDESPLDPHSLPEQIMNLARDMYASVPIRDRKYHLRTYKDCFIGREAVDWMVENSYAESEEAAVVVGRLLRRAGRSRMFRAYRSPSATAFLTRTLSPWHQASLIMSPVTTTSRQRDSSIAGVHILKGSASSRSAPP